MCASGPRARPTMRAARPRRPSSRLLRRCLDQRTHCGRYGRRCCCAWSCCRRLYSSVTSGGAGVSSCSAIVSAPQHVAHAETDPAARRPTPAAAARRRSSHASASAARAVRWQPPHSLRCARTRWRRARFSHVCCAQHNRQERQKMRTDCVNEAGTTRCWPLCLRSRRQFRPRRRRHNGSRRRRRRKFSASSARAAAAATAAASVV